MRRVSPRHGWILVVVLAVTTVALGDEIPDSEVNPQSGNVETVDTNSNGNVRHIIDPGQGQPIATIISSTDDQSPRIEIDSGGSSWVIWHRTVSGSSEVAMRRLDYGTSSWGPVRAVSDAGEDASEPELVLFGNEPWTAFEVDQGTTTDIVTGIIEDEPNPILGRTLLGSTSYTGAVDTLIHSESGKLWVTFVDSSSQVAWSEYDATQESWSALAFESYSGSSVAAARAEIRSEVLGL